MGHTTLFEPAAIRMGDQVVVLGPSCSVLVQPVEGEAPGCQPGTYRSASFDVKRGDWRAIDLPKELEDGYGAWRAGDYRQTRALGLTPDGTVVFALGPPGAEAYWTYNASSGVWVLLPGPGTRSYGQCLAGGKLVVLTLKYQYHGEILDNDPSTTLQPGEGLSYGEGDGYVLPRLAVLDLQSADLQSPEAWTVGQPLADELFNDSEPPKLACLGSSALVSDVVRSTQMRLYGLQDGKWRTPAPPPGADKDNFPPIPPMGTRVWTGRELVFLPTEEIGASAVAYSPSTDTWRTLTGLPPVTHMALWSGSAIVGYGESLRIVELPDLSHGLPDSRPERPRQQIAPSGVFEYALPK